MQKKKQTQNVYTTVHWKITWNAMIILSITHLCSMLLHTTSDDEMVKKWKLNFI
jgi:hypothetical protein